MHRQPPPLSHPNLLGFFPPIPHVVRYLCISGCFRASSRGSRLAAGGEAGASAADASSTGNANARWKLHSLGVCTLRNSPFMRLHYKTEQCESKDVE